MVGGDLICGMVVSAGAALKGRKGGGDPGRAAFVGIALSKTGCRSSVCSVSWQICCGVADGVLKKQRKFESASVKCFVRFGGSGSPCGIPLPLLELLLLLLLLAFGVRAFGLCGGGGGIEVAVGVGWVVSVGAVGAKGAVGSV